VRGIVLIAIELLIMNRAWELLPPIHGLRIHTAILTALGLSGLLAGLLVVAMQAGLRPAYGLALAAILLVGAEWTHAWPAVPFQAATAQPWLNRLQRGLGFLYALLFRQGGTHRLGASVPVSSFLEVVVLGTVYGRWLIDDPKDALRRGRNLGLAFLLTALVLRLLNGFGNVRPRLGNGWIDVLSLVASPPSITHTLLGTGGYLILIWALDQASTRAASVAPRLLWPLTLFGSVPLFFYVTHGFVYAAVGAAIVPWLAPHGISVLGMYALWLLGLLILLPCCVWYRRLKQRHPGHPILRYL
jgi:hypothetical protein